MSDFDKTELNAVIRSTFLGIEDHGLFVFNLDFDYGGSGQGTNRILACRDRNDRSRFVASGLTGEMITQILLTLEVDSWERLRGTHCRVRKNAPGLSGMVVGVGHFIKDKWVDFVEIGDKYRD